MPRPTKKSKPKAQRLPQNQTSAARDRTKSPQARAPEPLERRKTGVSGPTSVTTSSLGCKSRYRDTLRKSRQISSSPHISFLIRLPLIPAASALSRLASVHFLARDRFDKSTATSTSPTSSAPSAKLPNTSTSSTHTNNSELSFIRSIVDSIAAKCRSATERAIRLMCLVFLKDTPRRVGEYIGSPPTDASGSCIR